MKTAMTLRLKELSGIKYFSREMAGDTYGTYKDYIKGIDNKVAWKLIGTIKNIKVNSKFLWKDNHVTLEMIHTIESYKPILELNSDEAPILCFALCSSGRFMALTRTHQIEIAKKMKKEVNIFDKVGG